MISNFGWLIERRLAGMGHPVDKIADSEFLKDQGITAIVTLTERPLPQAVIEEFGFEYIHVPIPDFHAPSQEQIDQFIAFAERSLQQGGRLAVHCAAGYGRTGTMLACFLVRMGYDALEAMDEVRRKRPGSIETKEQEEAIMVYAARVDRGEKPLTGEAT